MEVDRALLTELSKDEVNQAPKLDGVFSIEDFMGDYEAKHATLKAEKSASNALKRSAPSKVAPAPKPVPGPVAIGVRSSKYTVLLHNKYQALGVPQPEFDIRGSSDQGWSGEVSFPGLVLPELQGIKDENVFNSKAEAKEGLSEKAYDILTRLEMQRRVHKVATNARVRTSKCKVAVHEKCQKLGLPNPFYEATGTADEGFSGVVSFPGLGLDELNLKDDGHYPRKVEAYEAVSKLALEALEKAEQEGKLARFGKAKGPAKQAPKEKEEPGPNYIGQLLGTCNKFRSTYQSSTNTTTEYQHAIGAPQPTYNDYRIGTLFACQITIESVKLDDTQIFGSLEVTRTSKKAARQEAARCAIEYYKSQGNWPEDFLDVGGIKKKKKLSINNGPELIASTAGEPDSRATSISSPNSTASYPQRVARLAGTLSLSTPEWRYTPTPQSDFHTCACYFSNGGAHAGPIGEVRNILGKKRAKEECARQTLEYLLEVQRARMECGLRMMQGVKGGEGVVEGALGRVREREREKEKEKEKGGGFEWKGGGEAAQMDVDEKRELNKSVVESGYESDVDIDMDDFEDAVEEIV